MSSRRGSGRDGTRRFPATCKQATQTTASTFQPANLPDAKLPSKGTARATSRVAAQSTLGSATKINPNATLAFSAKPASTPRGAGDVSRATASLAAAADCSTLELMVTQELGDPFRRDALKKPVRALDKYKAYTVA